METGVTQGRLDGFLANPLGFGQTVPLARAEEILGANCVADYASVSKHWVCSTLDPGCVPYSEGLLQSAAQLNESGLRTFRLVYLFGLSFDRQLAQSRDRTSGPRFTKAAQRRITEKDHPVWPGKFPSGYWLLDFSERFDQLPSKEIIDELGKAFPREDWAMAETVAEAVISLACACPKEELRLLTEHRFHIGPPKFLSQRWVVGDYRPSGLRVIPYEESGKLSGGKIGVVTLVAR